MKPRFSLYVRGHTYYCEDTTTGKQASLHTKDEAVALRLLNVKNEAIHHAETNLQIAQVYLQHSDPTLVKWTWQDVMDAMSPLKTGATQIRWNRAMRDMAFDPLRSRKLMETGTQHFLQILNAGTVSTNMFLRRLHNFAVGMLLATVAGAAKAAMAASRAQGNAGNHRRRTRADCRARAQSRNPRLLSAFVASWRLTDGHRRTDRLGY